MSSLARQRALQEGYSEEEIDAYLSSKNQPVEVAAPETIQPSREQKKPEALESITDFAQDTARKAAITGLGVGKGHPYVLGYDIASGLFNWLQRKAEDKQTFVPEVTPGAGIFENVPPELEPEERPSEAFQLPQTEDIISAFGDVIGVNLTPQTQAEDILDLFGTLKGIGGKQFSKLLGDTANKARAYEVGKNILYDGMLSTSAISLRDNFGTPEWATLIIGGTGIPILQKAGQATKAGAKAVGGKIKEMTLFDPRNIFNKNPVQSFREEIKKTKEYAQEALESGAMSAEQYERVKPFIDTAEEFGIPINLGSLTDSSYFKKVEDILAKTDVGEAAKNAIVQQATKQWADAQYQATRNMSAKHIFGEPNSVAEALLNDVTRQKQQALNDEASSLYSISRELFKGAKPITEKQRKQITDSFNDVIKKLDNKIIQAPVQAQTQSIAEDAVKKINKDKEILLYDATGNKISFREDITPQDLIGAVQALGDITLWETKSVRNLLKTPRQRIKEVLKEYGQTNAKAFEAYEGANKKYSEMSELFGDRGKWKKWGIYSDSTPEQLLNNLNSVSRLREFKKDFGKSAQGKLLIDELQRLKVNQELEPIFSQVDYAPGKIASQLQAKFRNPVINEMITPEVKRSLNDLANLDAFIQRSGGRRFFGYRTASEAGSPTANEIKALNFFSPSKWAYKLADKLSNDQLSQAYTDIIFNPNLLKEMTKIGEKVKAAAKEGTMTPSTFQTLKGELDVMFEAIAENAKTSSKIGASRKDEEQVELVGNIFERDQ